MSEEQRGSGGHSVEGGVLLRTSVSQVAEFDPGQYGGCNRAWWYHRVLRLPRPEMGSQRLGKEAHAQIELSVKEGRDALGHVARLARPWVPVAAGPKQIASGRLWVEERFAPGELTAAGVPFDGYVDLVNRSGYWVGEDGEKRLQESGEVELLDWKTTSSIADYAKTGAQLVETVQMPGYAEWSRRRWPELSRFRLSHVYMQTKNAARAEKRSVLIDAERLSRRWEQIEGVVRSMVDVAKETDEEAVEAHRPSCAAYRGCPYRPRCPLAPQEQLAQLGGTKMADLLNRLRGISDAPQAAPVAPAVAAAAPAVDPLDEEERKLAEASAALAAKKAAREAEAKARAEAEAVAAEKAKLLAEEAAARAAGAAAAAAQARQAVDPRQGSGVLAPDAPAVVSPDDAAPMSPEELATMEPGPAKDAAFAHASAHAAAHPPAEQVAKRSRSPKLGRGERPPKPEASASVAAAHQSAARAAVSEAVADALANPEGIHLYVDAVFESGPLAAEFEDLMPYVEAVCDALCSQAGDAKDVRCAPENTFLAYGKWKGALAAAVRLSPPAPGFYYLRHVRESEVKQAVVEALRPLCRSLVRGCP